MGIIDCTEMCRDTTAGNDILKFNIVNRNDDRIQVMAWNDQIQRVKSKIINGNVSYYQLILI